MKINNSVIIVATACLGISPWVRSDSLELMNGSKIVGTIQTIEKGTVCIETDFAGTLNIAMEKVTGISTDEDIFVMFSSGNTLLGQVGREGEDLTVDTIDGVMTVTESTITAAWREGQPNPTVPLPAPREWNYELAVDVSGKTGNTEKLTTGGSLKAELKTDKDRLLFYARGANSKENGKRTVDEVVGGVDYENNFSGKHSWYARTELESDNIEELDLRTTVAAGYGYYFLQNPKHELRGRLGFSYRHESFRSGRTSDSPGLDLGLRHMLIISDWAEVVNEVTYIPSFDNAADYRAFHESSLDVPLARSDNWKLRLGISNEYTSVPAVDSERMDTTYFARIVYGF